MKKKLIIGLIIVVVIVAIAFYFYKKNKNAKEESLPLAGTAPEASGGTKASLGPVAPTQVAASNPNPSSKVYNFVTVVRDGSRGKAIITYQPLVDTFKVGDSVKIASGPYAGTHKIWHIYNFKQGGPVAGPGQNLYLETDFTVADKGSFSKA